MGERKTKKTTMFRNIILIVLGLIILQLYLLGVDYFLGDEGELNTSSSNHNYQIDNTFSPHIVDLWTRQDIYSFYGTKGGLLLDTLNNDLYFLGKFSGNSPENLALLKLDVSSGEILWRMPDNQTKVTGSTPPTGLITNSENIFLSLRGTLGISGETLAGAAKIVAYDPSGQQQWSRSIGGARSITSLIANENNISVDGSFSSKYYLLNSDNGEEIQSTSKESSNFIWFIEDQINYEYTDNFILHAVDQSTGNTIWQYPIRSPVYLAPALWDDVFVLRTRENHFEGTVLAIDAITGNLLWEYQDVLSNVDVVNSTAHFLTNDNHLISLDIRTGKIIGETKFIPEKPLDPVNHVYQIAANDDTIFIYFGGNQQLSAYSFNYK